jgi:arsenite methyltransferase
MPILIEDYKRLLKGAGFSAVQIVDTRKDLNAYTQASDSGCCGTSSCCSAGESLHDRLAQLLARYDVKEYAASVGVYAMKT